MKNPQKRILKRMKRARLQDIAAAAGVGLATVDRVLNERGGVRRATAARVLEAARSLGANRTLPALHTRPLRIDVILSNLHPPFYRRLGAALADVALPLGSLLRIQQTYVDGIAVARKIRADRADYDGIVVVGGDHAEVRAAIGEAAAAGKAVVTLVSDVPSASRLAYVGIDNARAGRTAGYFLGRMLGGRGAVAVVTGDPHNRCQAEREAGFREALGRRFPGLRLAATVVGHEDDRHTFARLSDALADVPAIAGVYNTAGAVVAVADAIRAQHRPIAYVAHELTPDSRRLLAEGALDLVIDQNPELQARRAIEHLAIRFALLDKPPDDTPIPFTVHGPENAG
jgi:LacI family transcriptional regulator